MLLSQKENRDPDTTTGTLATTTVEKQNTSNNAGGGNEENSLLQERINYIFSNMNQRKPSNNSAAADVTKRFTNETV